MNSLQILAALEQGLIYSLVALATYLTFRMIDFPDLTVDGSFTLGAAVTALLISKQIDPFLAMLLATLAGSLAGALTGWLSIKWDILNLLSGILVMIALYSLNLRIMGGPNISLFNEMTVYQTINGSSLWITSIIILLIASSVISFLNSQFGLAIRASGLNKLLSRAYGIKTGSLTILVLMIANAFVALSGSLFAQLQGFSDISMGPGTVIVGLASVIIGESLFKSKAISLKIASCLIGSILYSLSISFALSIEGFGLKSSDINIITSGLVGITLIFPKLKISLSNQIKQKRVAEC